MGRRAGAGAHAAAHPRPGQPRRPHAEGRRPQPRAPLLAARARRERAQVEAAIARFAGQTLRLSDLVELAEHEFDLLLSLLDTAL